MTVTNTRHIDEPRRAFRRLIEACRTLAPNALFELLDEDGEEVEGFRDCESQGAYELSLYAGECDLETLVVFDGRGRLASFLLVWDCSPDGSDIVADYSDNDFGNAVFEQWLDAI